MASPPQAGSSPEGSVFSVSDLVSWVRAADDLEVTELADRMSRTPVPEVPLDRAVARDQLVRALRTKVTSPSGIVDAWMQPREAPATSVDTTIGSWTERMTDPEPWPEPVDAAKLLHLTEESLRMFVAIPEPAAFPILAVWCLYTWVYDCFDYTPYLNLTSPQWESGKSRLSGIIEPFCRRALPAGGVSAAVVFRVIEDHHPTLFIDEVDQVFGRGGDKDLQGVLNNGFERGHGYLKNVPTSEGGWEPKLFDTYCPKVLSGIGAIPRTLHSRSITVSMRRKRVDDEIERFPRRERQKLHAYARDWKSQAARWALDNRDALSISEPELPDGLGDREADMLEPLFAVADAVGGNWPSRVRSAAQRLAKVRVVFSDDNVADLLLKDIASYFAKHEVYHVTTEELVVHLGLVPDRPWMNWRDGDTVGMTPVKLAALLRPFGVRPVQLGTGAQRGRRGYQLDQAMQDAIARYL